MALEEVVFQSCSQNNLYWDWDFGDGYSSSDENPTHIYQVGGEYTVTLIVGDDVNEHIFTMVVVVEKAAIFYHPQTIISNDSTWVEGLHIVQGTIQVSGATLTIEPGAKVKFENGPDKRIEVGLTGFGPAAFIANGTVDLPILFTSNSASPANNSWGAILFGPEASGPSSISYATIEYGGSRFNNARNNAPVEFLDGGTANISNTTIQNTNYFGLYLSELSAFSTFSNNIIDVEATNGYPIALDGDNLSTYDDNLNTIKGLGIYITSSKITSDVTLFPLSLPYYTEHSFLLGTPAGTVFTVTAGCEINFAGGGAFHVRYTTDTVKLVIEGTAANPVLVQAADPTRPWSGLHLKGNYRPDSYISHATLLNGKDGYSKMISAENTTLNMSNTYIGNGAGAYTTIHLFSTAKLGVFENNTIDKGFLYSMYIEEEHLNNFPVTNTFLGVGEPNAVIWVMASNISTSTFNISTDFTITDAGAPYYIAGDITVGDINNPLAGPTLTIQEGATLLFQKFSGLYVGTENASITFEPSLDATLIVNGTATNPVRFGVQPDNADWDGIFFYLGTNKNSVMNYAQVEKGRLQNVRIKTNNAASLTPYPTITNSTFSGSGGYAIFVDTNSNPNIDPSNTYVNNVQNIVFYNP